uniref:Ring finger protein 4 n=1 Tax=Catagonus wagneri TaxID=51154 RepID=A0A8C3YPF8_9CETA
MSTRKRRGGAVNSRQAQKRTREPPSTPEMALEAEPIELVESAGDEIVDLTCESLEPVVVDLTHNDSVVIVEGEWIRLLFRRVRVESWGR